MGIPGFKPGIRAVTGAGEVVLPDEADGLFFDLNAIIHPVARQFRDDHPQFDGTKEGGLIKECCGKIIDAVLKITNTYRPKGILYIAVDGAIPMAKIQNQKQRRYASGVHLGPRDYNSTFITPGTEFMAELHKELLEFMPKFYSGDKVRTHVVTVVYSSYLDPGEGEHKIKDYIRKHNIQGINILYGNDSDLILLALGLQRKGLYVCGDTVHIVRGQKIRDPFDIDFVRAALVKRMGADYILDFIFACSLLGNDFLPRFVIFSNVADGIQTILELLRINGGMLSSLELLQYTLSQLATMESFSFSNPAFQTCTRVIAEKVKKKEIFEDKDTGRDYVMFRSPIFDTLATYPERDKDNVLRCLWYRKMMPGLPSNDGKFGMVSGERIASSCIELLRGLFWVYHYYISGQDAVTWLWYYPYHYAPFFADVSKTLSIVPASVLRDEIQDVRPIEGEVRFTPLHQLVAVMPWQSIKYLPRELTDVFFVSTSPLIDMMPSTIVEDLELTATPSQTKAIVPFADYYTIMTEMSSIILSPKLIKENEIQAPWADKQDTQNYGDQLKREAWNARESKRESAISGGRGAEPASIGNVPKEEAPKEETPFTESRGRGGRGRGSRGRGSTSRQISSFGAPQGVLQSRPEEAPRGISFQATRGGGSRIY